MSTPSFGRRRFARLLALGGPATVLAAPLLGNGRSGDERLPGGQAPGALPPTPASPDEAFWRGVRQQFLVPPDLAILNAANLCPSSAPAIEALTRVTQDIDRDPSIENRRKAGEGREAARRTIADTLRVSPEEILITRNTSEGNNIVSSGLDLKAGDEVVILSDNHPSAHAAFREKARRSGFTVTVVQIVSPHPGADYYVEAFAKAITPRTKLVAITHVTASAGDLIPAREICRVARERGALTLVDAAQSFGVLDIDLSDMQPDFFTGSAHKWPCGPREVGVLYVNRRVQAQLWPSVISLYAGALGISKTHGGLGQRDEAAMIGFAEALRFQTRIGRTVIETRSRLLAQRLMAQLNEVAGVTLWTSRDPARSAAIVTFKPGHLDPAKLASTLYERERIACTARSGADRPGIRLSPHFYNLEAEVDRTVAAVRKYISA
ncbi:MAG TPA: aminotransferase class V-fold PLP-dependent enzyme [Vicinamibacterales bacterium]|jgi:selenocysteine lyase/cysteine desulfurase